MSESSDLDSEIKKTQETLGKYVKKPALTDKLLKKPPFRFLHDVISAVGHLKAFLHSSSKSITFSQGYSRYWKLQVPLHSRRNEVRQHKRQRCKNSFPSKNNRCS